jgi:hemerythrin-like domain-containing protein
MVVTGGEIRDLLGEHEGIRSQLNFLVKSQEKLVTQDIKAKEHLWAYRCGLYDFRDIIRFHIEVDERIFKALFGDSSPRNSREEHREIQKVVNELIEVADSAVIEKLEPEELQRYTEKIGLAFNKTHELIETHIAVENAVLQEALEKLEAAV